MLTKYILHTVTLDYELKPCDLKNWDEIIVSYNRPSYDGVVRSFTSKFEFTSEARDLLLGIYLRDGLSAEVSLEVKVITDAWTWAKVFSCPLDFSTVTWDNTTFSINALDNSLSALIKANKGTKYEFVIGEDINRDTTLHFDRLPMMENVTYEFTQGTQYDNGDLGVTFSNEELPFMGEVGSEISVGHTVYWQDDQTDERNSYILEAVKDIEITLDYDYSYLASSARDIVYFYLCIRRKGNTSNSERYDCGLAVDGHYSKVPGTFTSTSQLPDASQAYRDYGHPEETVEYTVYAVVNETVWKCTYIGSGYEWRSTGLSEREFCTATQKGSVTVSLKAGDQLYIDGVCGDSNGNNPSTTAYVRMISSSFRFSWTAVGDSCNIDVFKPATILSALLRKICGDSVNAEGYISTSDNRISDTYLIAAESARGISGAKLYSSFNEFCEWMEAVFGYVWYLEDPQMSSFTKVKTVAHLSVGAYSSQADESLFYYGEIDPENIYYFNRYGKFFYMDPVSRYLYTRWDGWTEYNDPSTLLARTDTLFRFPSLGEGLYYIDSKEALPREPKEYTGTEESMQSNTQRVVFLHRSELFKGENRREIPNVTDLKYEVDSAQIYSAIKIGYDKKDYDSINGRDEFNFNNTYTTGCHLSDKTLQLISKYRADSYGIEFAVQKRGEDTTDSTSDNDLFFLLATRQRYTDDENNVFYGLVPDRSIQIDGTLNSKVFNGAFSPMACVRANEGYIGLQAREMNLAFASSEGNSEITVDGVPMKSDLEIKGDILTNGAIEFTCGDPDDIADTSELITVTSGGITYRGFLKGVDIRYAKSEEVKYKLIIKDIIQ